MRWPAIPSLPGEQAARYRPCPSAEPDQALPELPPDRRPQDPTGDGKGWTFETLEHGGEYPDNMPQAIRATDAEGRSCIYVPIKEDGQVVDSLGFELRRESAGARG